MIRSKVMKTTALVCLSGSLVIGRHARVRADDAWDAMVANVTTYCDAGYYIPSQPTGPAFEVDCYCLSDDDPTCNDYNGSDFFGDVAAACDEDCNANFCGVHWDDQDGGDSVSGYDDCACYDCEGTVAR